MKRNIAVIGNGHWGKNLLRNFHELKALSSVCDLDEEKLNDCAKKYPEIPLYNNFRAVLDDPEVEAVAIATPAATHYKLASQALLANKDVFVEKPMALSYREGEHLVDLAEKRSRILMVGHILEYHPAIIKLNKMIQEGILGKIQYIYSSRLNLGKFRMEENILWSFAPHDISVMLFLLREMPSEVSAFGGNYLDPDITDVTVTNLNFPSGSKGHIFVSWLHPYKEQKLCVIGDRSMLVFDDTESKNKLLSFNHKIDWIENKPISQRKQAIPISVAKTEPLKLECQHFIECLTSRKTPLTDGHNGLRVLKVLEACQKSLKKNGSPQHIDPFKQ